MVANDEDFVVSVEVHASDMVRTETLDVAEERPIDVAESQGSGTRGAYPHPAIVVLRDLGDGPGVRDMVVEVDWGLPNAFPLVHDVDAAARGYPELPLLAVVDDGGDFGVIDRGAADDNHGTVGVLPEQSPKRARRISDEHHR